MRVVRLTLVVSMVIVCIWTLVVALVFALQCRPMSVAWGIGTDTCLSTSVMGNTRITLSVMDMTASWLYALRLRLKISILVLLRLDAVNSIATIVRLKYAIEVAQMSSKGGLASADIIQTSLKTTVYSMIEIGLSIFAASLTALRPLLRKVPCFSDISSGGYLGTWAYTFCQGSSRVKRPSYRLYDRNVSDADSGETN
ncbi:hypothetical protein EDB80DRAFT_749452 [Ilyonectria destructans]|nr:hypothetical protein EDB80DRAFT_749452 [Ilyonectria destructans]